MNVFQCWEEQRETLRPILKEQSALGDMIYSLRHALTQTEQNALASQEDDVLRQQMGVLFGMVKSALAFLEINVSATRWVAASQKTEPRDGGRLTLLGVTGLCILFCGVCCYFRGILLGWIAALCALILGSAALIKERKQKRVSEKSREAQMRITLHPDVDNLLAILDGQMRSIDRCANDFAYLNEGLRGESKGASAVMVSRISSLLEALYEYEGEARAPAEEAVNQMLKDMGLKALAYSEESRKLFTTLPSKDETRTIAPAIVDAEDLRLLKRGTAAVKMDAA